MFGGLEGLGYFFMWPGGWPSGLSETGNKAKVALREIALN